MKSLIVLIFAVGVSTAPQHQNSNDVQILSYEVDNTGLDSYRFAYQLSDGSRHEEQGQLNKQGTEGEALSVKGSYSWVAPDGVTYVVNYIADENGFQPQIEMGPGGCGVPQAVIDAILGHS